MEGQRDSFAPPRFFQEGQLPLLTPRIRRPCSAATAAAAAAAATVTTIAAAARRRRRRRRYPGSPPESSGFVAIDASLPTESNTAIDDAEGGIKSLVTTVPLITRGL